jgi:nitrilase
MRVACIQMCSGGEVEANLGVVAGLLEHAAAEKVRLAVLPENFSFMHPDNARKHHVAAEVVPATVLPFLAEAASRHGMTIVGGSVLLAAGSGKLRNACPVYGPDGSCLGIYDKMHLFDVDLPGERYRESELVEGGSRPLSVDVEGWRVGLSICYDLRFPELYRHYAGAGCHLLTVPSAFTVRTGRAHWEVLLRARAIENQAYVLAPAQVGTHPGGRRTWGRTLIVDPWGEIAAEGEAVEQGDEAALVTAEISLERVEEVRRLIPSLNHRRMPLRPREPR